MGRGCQLRFPEVETSCLFRVILCFNEFLEFLTALSDCASFTNVGVEMLLPCTPDRSTFNITAGFIIINYTSRSMLVSQSHLKLLGMCFLFSANWNALISLLASKCTLRCIMGVKRLKLKL